MHWICTLLFIQLFTGNGFCSDDLDITRSLRAIITKYQNTDKDSDHSYVEPYERLLSSFTEEPCNLLEIGVNFGGSAIMWYTHLPKSNLFLLDNRNVMKPHIVSSMDSNRWHLFVGDAYTPQMVARMQQECPAGFDIIIDDGPHSFESQKFVITSYLSLLNKGGVLIIEDVQDINLVERLQEYVPANSEFQLEIIDLRNLKNRYDDILFVVKRTY